MRKLPPLRPLRAFEATARLGGLSKAGDELHVTHGAVSRQIQQLEDWLGVELFDRAGRGLTPTEPGRDYQRSISAAFQIIEEATQRVQHHRPPRGLGLVTTHSIASSWLMDRLPDFAARHPEIELWLTLEQGLTDFERSGLDAALRMGEGPWPDLECVPVMRDRLIVVCSPEYLAAGPALSSPGQLGRHRLLHDEDPAAQWQRWTRVHAPDLDATVGPRFSSGDVLLRAAMGGQGVALVSEALAAGDLAAKRLIQPLPQAVDLGIHFWLVMPARSRNNPHVVAFRDWLLRQAG